jgi:hypothetical protein
VSKELPEWEVYRGTYIHSSGHASWTTRIERVCSQPIPTPPKNEKANAIELSPGSVEKGTFRVMPTNEKIEVLTRNSHESDKDSHNDNLDPVSKKKAAKSLSQY